jgi:hypothetical protein
MSKIAPAGLLNDTECSFLIESLLKMINFDSELFNFVQF